MLKILEFLKESNRKSFHPHIKLLQPKAHNALVGDSKLYTFATNIPRWEWGCAGGAGGYRLGGGRAATQDGSIGLILQDAGPEAPLLILGKVCGISGQRHSIGLKLAGPQLVKADRPVLPPVGTRLQRNSRARA